MLWCPNCRKEYQPGFKTCSECNADLVNELGKGEIPEYDKEEFLVSVSNIIEANIIKSLLNSNNIPVLKKLRNADGYLDIYMGATNCGVDLFVPSKLLEEARNIILANPEFEEENIEQSDDTEASNLEKKYKTKQRIRTWIILLIFVPGLLWILIGIFLYLYQWIIKLI